MLLKNAINHVFSSKVYKDRLILGHAFLDGKQISCLHVTWRGQSYKDMNIYIDLVVALKLFSYKCLIDVFKSTDKHYKDKREYSVFYKGVLYEGFAVAFNDTEYHIMSVLPPALKRGFIYAKALRIADFFPWHIFTKLKDVYNLEDSLKTYMLKTSLFFACFM